MNKNKRSIPIKSRQSLVLACIILGFTLFSYLFSILFPDIVQTFDARFQDNLFRLRYVISGKGKISPFIVHTVFNDETLKKYNLSLLDRKIYADLITALNNAGAGSIAFDIFFQHPGKDPDDHLLVQAAREDHNTYFPVIIFPEQAAASVSEISKDRIWYPRVNRKGNPYNAGTIITPFKDLADAATGLGHVNINPDFDGITRRFPLLYHYKDGYIPSLTLQQVCAYLKVQPSDIDITFGSHIRLKNARFRGNLQKDIVIPINNRGEVRINYIAPWQDSFYEYSTEELLTTLTDSLLSARLRDEIEHSLVIVSDNSTRNNDIGTGIFEKVYPNSEIHVTIANMILTGEFIYEPGIVLSLFLTLVFGVCIWFFSLNFRILKLLLCSLGLFAGYIMSTIFLFIFAHSLLQMMTISLCFLFSLSGCTFYRFLIEEQTLSEEKKKSETLQIIDNLKTRFLYNITDDLQSPLSPVISLSRDMKEHYEQYDKEKVNHALKQINDGAATLCTKIEELSEFAKLDAGLLSLHCEETRIIPLIEFVKKTVKEEVDKKKIALSFKAESTDVSLFIDSRKVKKILQNIIENAVTFTHKKGKIDILLSQPIKYSGDMYKWKRKSGKPDTVIRISIADNGAGIEKKYHELIFKRFWKPPEVQNAAFHGTGIGLSLAKEYAELHGGHIDVSSIPGQGSTFTITFPVGKKHLNESEIIFIREKAGDSNLVSESVRTGTTEQIIYPDKSILIVNDDQKEALSWKLILSAYQITNVTILAETEQEKYFIENEKPFLVLADHSMPRFSGFGLLSYIKENCPDTPVIITAGTVDHKTALQCIKAGAADYLFKPINGKELYGSVNHFIELYEINKKRNQMRIQLDKKGDEKNPFSEIITNNLKMKEIFTHIKRIAPTSEHILIRGETGTGKELIAEAIHKASGHEGELVLVNSAGLDDTLFSDTLFGHVRGAYTDAKIKRDGLLKTAGKGTIFLDEIGDLKMKSQIKLLRLLQTGDYYPLGSNIKEVSHARIVAATNADLEELVEQKIFRKDLYYRLNPFEIKIPPLRERPEDIDLLIEYFLEKYHSTFNYKVADITIRMETKRMFSEYSYPGNVRELENILKAAISKMKNNELPHTIVKEKMGYEKIAESATIRKYRIFYSGRIPTLGEAEAFFISEAMKAADKNKTKAAELLGITRFALKRKIHKNPF